MPPSSDVHPKTTPCDGPKQQGDLDLPSSVASRLNLNPHGSSTCPSASQYSTSAGVFAWCTVARPPSWKPRWRRRRLENAMTPIRERGCNIVASRDEFQQASSHCIRAPGLSVNRNPLTLLRCPLWDLVGFGLVIRLCSKACLRLAIDKSPVDRPFNSQLTVHVTFWPTCSCNRSAAATCRETTRWTSLETGDVLESPDHCARDARCVQSEEI